MLTTSLLMGNAPSAAASENPNTTDTTLITGSPPGNDALEVTDSADTAEPAPEAEQAPEPTPQPEPEPAPNPAPEPAPAPETGAEIEDNSAPAQEDMTLSTTDTGTTTDTTADDSGNSEPGTTEIETPAEGTLGTYLEVFTDEGLRTAVMAKTGAQDEDEILTQETAESITNLDASEKGITDLEGIQHLTELTNLSLDNNQIADITPLEKLTSLTNLELHSEVDWFLFTLFCWFLGRLISPVVDDTGFRLRMVSGSRGFHGDVGCSTGRPIGTWPVPTRARTRMAWIGGSVRPCTRR